MEYMDMSDHELLSRSYEMIEETFPDGSSLPPASKAQLALELFKSIRLSGDLARLSTSLDGIANNLDRN